MIHHLKQYLLSLCIILPTVVTGADYNITGYFTHVYAREHVRDMPREFFMLITKEGSITPMVFNNYSSANKGDLGKWKFDPRTFLGKTITMSFTGTPEQNNNEYAIYEGSSIKLIERVSVEIINSLTVVSENVTVEEKYRYPQADTLFFPHDVVIPEESYADKIPVKSVQLKNYVTGNGTEASPYTSADGYAGLKAAIADLPDGGTIEVASGVYKATSNMLAIPRFVSIKGVGNKKPCFILTNDRMWFLKGSNTIDYIDVDVTQINRTYTHEVISIDNNARDVTIKNSKFIGNYAVDPVTYKESGNVVMFRMYSHLKNIIFDADTIIAPLRGIVTKGQRNQHNIVIKNSVFKDQGQMCMSFDQSSDITNVVVENNKFIEFTHFGVAFARINDVTIRNNTFYSRNLLAFNTYNQALHIEEHCQNFLIENNDIDVKLRTSDSNNPNTKVRCPGILITDSRQFTIRNNRLKNSDILMLGIQSRLIGYSKVVNNSIDNGGIDVRESNRFITFSNNTISNSPEHAFEFYSVIPMAYPFGNHTVDSNNISGLTGAQPFYIKGEIRGLNITNNEIRGCTQTASTLDIAVNSEKIIASSNTFFGVSSNAAFSVVGTLPAGVSITEIKNGNSFITDCNAPSANPVIRVNSYAVYPNPVKAGKTVVFSSDNQTVAYTLNSLNGALIKQGKGRELNTSNLNSGIYLLHLQNEGKAYCSKLVVL